MQEKGSSKHDECVALSLRTKQTLIRLKESVCVCVCVFVSVYVKMWLVHIVEEILDSASQNGVFLLIIIII